MFIAHSYKAGAIKKGENIMNKLFTKIAAIVLGATMATGVGVAVASNTKDVTKTEAAAGDKILDYSASGFGTSYGVKTGTAKGTDNTTDYSWVVTAGGNNTSLGSNSKNFSTVTKLGTTYQKYGTPVSVSSTTTGISVFALTTSMSDVGSISYSGTQGKGTTQKVYALYSSDNSTFSQLTLTGTATQGSSFSSGTVFEFDKCTGYFALLFQTTATSGDWRIDGFGAAFFEGSSGAASHDLTYAVGTQGVYDGSTTKTFSVEEEGSHTVKSPADVGISGNTGYVFTNWNDGTNNYSPSSTYTMGTSDVTLTAQWVAGVGLSYDKNNAGASGTMETTYVISGGTQTVASCTFTAPSGKVFDHWNTSTDDSGTDYDPTDTITNFSSALTLYAIWEDAPVFELVTDASQLTPGTKAIFVSQGTYSSVTYTSAMVTERTTANAASTVVSATLSDGFNAGSIATATGATVYTLGGTIGAWTLKNGSNQLGFTGTSNNNMKFNETMDDTFTITSSGNNVDVISNSFNTRELRYNVNQGSPRFSNYASGAQTAIYMFADIAESSFGTVDHIKVSHTPNILSWHDGSTFSDDGLVVVAFDGADETTANSKLLESSEYTSSVPSGTTFDDSDIGSKTITISYAEDSSMTDTYSIYVYAAATYELVSETPSSWAGNYLIVATIETGTEHIAAGTYAFMSDLSDYDVPTNPVAVSPVTDPESGAVTITTGQEFEWSIASITGGYSLQGKGGKYVGWENSSKNGMTSSDSAIVNTISNSGSTVQIANTASTTRYLSLSSASGQFRYYTSGSVQLYKLVESSDVSDYADMFLETLLTGEDAVCDPAGISTDLGDLKTAWKDLADLFDLLSNADKQQFTQGTADEDGDNVAKALALYDFIAAKYNTRLEGEGYVSDYDFMDRNISPAGRITSGLIIKDSSTMIPVIVIVAIVSVSAIGGYFFLRKRKEHN